MTKSEMFKNAHAFTKRLIQHHHVKGTYRELFAKSLKQWHKNMKAEKAEAMAKANKPVATEISEKFVTVKEWIIKKNLSYGQAIAVIDYADCYGKVLKETEKAVFVKFTSKLGIVTSWFPKSTLVK